MTWSSARFWGTSFLHATVNPHSLLTNEVTWTVPTLITSWNPSLLVINQPLHSSFTLFGTFLVFYREKGWEESIGAPLLLLGQLGTSFFNSIFESLPSIISFRFLLVSYSSLLSLWSHLFACSIWVHFDQVIVYSLQLVQAFNNPKFPSSSCFISLLNLEVDVVNTHATIFLNLLCDSRVYLCILFQFLVSCVHACVICLCETKNFKSVQNVIWALHEF